MSENCEGQTYDPNSSGIHILDIGSRRPFWDLLLHLVPTRQQFTK